MRKLILFLFFTFSVIANTCWSQCTPVAGNIAFDNSNITNFASKNSSLPSFHIALCAEDVFNMINDESGSLPPPPLNCTVPGSCDQPVHGFVGYKYPGPTSHPFTLSDPNISNNTVKAADPLTTYSIYLQNYSLPNPPPPFGAFHPLKTYGDPVAANFPSIKNTVIFNSFTFDFTTGSSFLSTPPTNTGESDPDGDDNGCYAFGQNEMLYVTCLNPITASFETLDPSTSSAACAFPGKASIEITIKGGFPEFFDDHQFEYNTHLPPSGFDNLGDIASYTISNLSGIGTLASTTVDDHNGTVVLGDLNPGDNFSIEIDDNNGCPFTYSGTVPAGAPAPPDALINSTDTITCVNSTSLLQLTANQPGGTWSEYPSGNLYTNASTGEFNPQSSGCGEFVIQHTVNQSGVTCSDTQRIIVLCPKIDSLVTTNPSCPGDADGKIDVFASGFDSASFIITGGAFPPSGITVDQSITSFTGLSPDVYTIAYENSNRCADPVTASVTIEAPEPLTITVDIKNVSCKGESDGKITLANFSGGTPPFTYNWENTSGSIAETDSVAENLSASTYAVTISDSRGCDTIISGMTITEPLVALFIDNLMATDIKCFGDSDAEICPLVSGGSGAYTFAWSGNIVSSDSCIVNLAAGTYDFSVTDATGCTKTSSQIITSPTSALVLTDQHTNISCFGANDGSVSAGVTGGESPYNFAWDNTSTDSLQTGLSVGNYSLTLTDQRGCIDSIDMLVEEPLEITIDSSITPVVCKGESNGAASITVLGGTPSYTYQWNDPSSSTSSNITNVVTGAYTVTVSDANNCSIIKTYTIPESAVPMSVDPILDSTTCIDGTDGVARVDVNGGTAPFDYEWQGYPSNQADTLPGLVPGDYTVTVTDSFGCEITVTTSVISPSSIIIDMISDSVTCNGLSDGNGIAVIGDGYPPYEYEWFDATGNTLNDIDSTVNTVTAGWYYIHVVDNSPFKCLFTDSVEIKEPPVFEITSLSSTSSTCPNADGSITVSATGGVPLSSNANDYNFSWTDNNSNTYTGANLTNVPGGIFMLNISDKNNCSIDSSITVDEIVVLDISTDLIIDSISCFGGNDGSIVINPLMGNGPFNFTWPVGINAGGNTALDLTPDSYPVTISDADGCTKDTLIAVFQPDSFFADTFNTIGVSCFSVCDGSVELDIQGGNTPYQVDWLDDGNFLNFSGSFSSFCGGMAQTILVKDNKGCEISRQVDIHEPDLLTITTIVGVDPSCYNYSDGSIIVTANGGTENYNYTWSHDIGFPNSNPSGLSADTFSVTVTDANGCVIDTGIRLLNPDPIAITATSIADTCDRKNGSITIDQITGNANFPDDYTFNWSTGVSPGNTQNALQLHGLTSYSVTVTDIFSCTKDTTVYVDEIAGPSIASLDLTHVTCFDSLNGSATITGTAGTPSPGSNPYSYQWGPGQTGDQISQLPAGSYSVTVSDANQCPADTLFEITQPSKVLANILPADSICEPPLNELTLISDPSGGTGNSYDFQWSTGASNSSITITGVNYGDNFTLTVFDENNCPSELVNFEPSFFEPLTITLIADTQICPNTDLSLTPQLTGGNTSVFPDFLWNDNQTTATGNFSPNFPNDTFSVSASRGCAYYTATTAVSFFTNPSLEIASDLTQGCPPLDVTFTNLTPDVASCNWTFSDGQSIEEDCAPLVTFEEEDCQDVSLTILTTDGCTLDSTFMCFVETYEKPVADFIFTPDSSTIIDSEIEFIDYSTLGGAQEGIVDWTWVFNDQDSVIGSDFTTYEFPREVGEYPVELIVTDSNGCENSTSKNVKVAEIFNIYIPNAFTPGICDGINDCFGPVIVGLGDFYEMKIYNRWGELIFKTLDYENCWNGRYSNYLGDGLAPTGSYVYKIRLRDKITKRPREYSGQFLLIENSN